MNRAPFRAAIAFDTDWRQATERCLADLEGTQGATLGFCYLSDHIALHAEAILARLREATGVEHWVGAVGVGLVGSNDAAIDRSGLSVMLAQLPVENFSVFSGRRPLPPFADSPPYFAVVHADPQTPDMTELITDMAGKVESGFVTGGLVSSRSRHLQVADDVISGGISGVAFTAAVAVATRLTQGCLPLPARHRVTSAEGNVVASIDDRPALDAYKSAIGPKLAKDLRAAVQQVLVGLPVPGREAGNYLVRQIVAIDPKSGLIAVNEEVQDGQTLLFCQRDGDAAEADMRRMLTELKATLAGPPRGGLYFSCLGRGSNAFASDTTEIELIRECLGEVPLTGFFCNGEISHDRLYGFTGVLTLFT